jgi:putative endonuclease
MKTVYLLRSLSRPDQFYTGLTGDLEARLISHNAGQVPHTSKFPPWELIAAIGFPDEKKAADFERYLKSGSGRAFANRHFR